MSPEQQTAATSAAGVAAAASERRVPFAVVEPPGRLSLDFGELWRNHELLYFLVWRDLKVRYKQTVLGVMWALLQPLTAMLIFTVIFGRFVKVPSQGVPYPVFVFTGLLVWLYFSQAVTSAGTSIVANQALITKVHFPRIVIPGAGVTVPLVDFALSAVVLGGLMAVYGVVPGWHIVFALPIMLLVVVTAFGIGLWVSALNVRYRDVPYALPFVLQLWMYASPVVYPVQLIPQKWQWVFGLNPLAGAIDGMRWAVLGTGRLDGSVLAVGAVAAAVLSVSGTAYFRRVEDHFADLI